MLIVLSVIIYAWISRVQYEEKVAKEDITFARIETYVNTAKAYLESELPNGGWQIEKYCKEPGSKGTIDAYNYGCYYGVSAVHEPGSAKILEQVAKKIAGNANVYTGSSQSTFLVDTTVNQVPKSCGFISWEESGIRLGSIGCTAHSLVLRYNLE